MPIQITDIYCPVILILLKHLDELCKIPAQEKDDFFQQFVASFPGMHLKKKNCF